MNYTDAAEMMLHKLSLHCDPERLEQIQEIAALLAETSGRDRITKGQLVAATMAAGIEFVEVGK